jgi:F1F0 ATPase subunit 2
VSSFSILLRVVAGISLGIFFYAGLWLTVRSLPKTRHPVFITLGSFWLRTAAVLACFLVLVRGRWQYAAACLLGFLMGRLAVTIPLRAPTPRTKCP